MNKNILRVSALILCLMLALFVGCSKGNEQSGDRTRDWGDYSGEQDYEYYTDPDPVDYGDSGYGGYSGNYGGTSFYSGFGTPVIMGGGCSSTDLLMVLILVGIIILVLWLLRRRQQTPVVTDVKRTDDADLTSMENYVANIDPNFSVSDMEKKLSNLYVQMQDAWCAKDITPIRPYLTDEFYEQSDRQVDAMRKSERTAHVENISVLAANVRGYFQRDGLDHLIVEMSTRITDYITDNNTGEIVKGSNTVPKFMTYEWDLVRPTGVKTGESDGMQAINCPNCGAPVSINKTAKCPYCDTVITVNAKDWVLSTVKGLKQRTGS